MAISAEKHQGTRQVFLWLMACTYLFAFASLYTQIPGLYGDNGLTPVSLALPANDNSSWWVRLVSFPSLLQFHQSVDLSPSVAMELLCVGGALLSLFMMVFRAMRCSLLYGLLFALYLSVYKVGQVFLWFQWDSLLLEAGFIAVLVAPFNLVFWRRPASRCHDGLTLWLVRWLLFRLMFASGVVKLQSQCPTWWDLTALYHHFESQCIPTPLAWYAHHVPSWLLKLGVVGTYWIESVTPLLFFVPVRSLRLLGFLAQVLLQLLIIATGNYNFFNLLTITLSFSLVDDRFLGYATSTTFGSPLSLRVSRGLFGRYGSMVRGTVQRLVFVTVLGVLASLTVYYFNIHLGNKTLNTKIGFSNESFDIVMETAIPLLAAMGALSLATEVLSALLSSFLQYGLLAKLWSLFQTLLFTMAVVLMFSISLPSFGVLDRTFYSTIPSPLRTLHDSMDHFSVTNPYGLFRKMTGVDGRPELIVEGSMDEKEWKEYEFLYKPGDVTKAPAFVAPHQPRLDWQMWFAALGTYQNNPWLVHLAHKLLLGQKEVIRLMAPPPFATPPTFVRARLFTYQFTEYDHQKPFYNQTSVWWERNVKSDYLFSLTRDNQNLLDFVSKHYLIPKNSYPPTPLSDVLVALRAYSDFYYPPTILWALFFTGLMATLSMYALFPDQPSSQLLLQAGRETKTPGAVRGKQGKVETIERDVKKRHVHKNKNQ
ncbi:lipase maturation factor 2-like isoform X2 [Halichondria panicea]|uniref:lipase maturation factor 2-like isoform X2 n=1 Tax=Halichondria panicea TaxID=6063 RepID=UPI00312BABDD